MPEAHQFSQPLAVLITERHAQEGSGLFLAHPYYHIHSRSKGSVPVVYIVGVTGYTGLLGPGRSPRLQILQVQRPVLRQQVRVLRQLSGKAASAIRRMADSISDCQAGTTPVSGRKEQTNL